MPLSTSNDTQNNYDIVDMYLFEKHGVLEYSVHVLAFHIECTIHVTYDDFLYMCWVCIQWFIICDYQDLFVLVAHV